MNVNDVYDLFHMHHSESQLFSYNFICKNVQHFPHVPALTCCCHGNLTGTPVEFNLGLIVSSQPIRIEYFCWVYYKRKFGEYRYESWQASMLVNGTTWIILHFILFYFVYHFTYSKHYSRHGDPPTDPVKTGLKLLTIVIYLDFHSTKRAMWLVDSWSRAADQLHSSSPRAEYNSSWSVHD